MGTPEIKYGDSICFVQHVDSGLWLTYQTVDAKSTRMGVAQRKVKPYIQITVVRESQGMSQSSFYVNFLERKLNLKMYWIQDWIGSNLQIKCFQAILHREGHMDDGLTLSRCQKEESHTARLIRSATLLFTRFIRYWMLIITLILIQTWLHWYREGCFQLQCSLPQ